MKEKVYIFDLDGTLYNLKSLDGTYANSSLKKEVDKNVLKFISCKENINYEQSVKVLELAQQDPIGISNFLSIKYKIIRKDYFDEVWGNLDFTELVDRNELKNSKKILLKLINRGNIVILLTSAPQIWALKAVKELGKIFEEVISGELYTTKQEVFIKLVERYGAQNLISIGDQYETDIKPAQELSIKTFLVNKTNPLSNLLKEYE